MLVAQIIVLAAAVAFVFKIFVVIPRAGPLLGPAERDLSFCVSRDTRVRTIPASLLFPWLPLCLRVPIPRRRMLESPVDRNPSRPPGFPVDFFGARNVPRPIEPIK